MKNNARKLIREALLHEAEEESIGISLFTTFYQNSSELHFFSRSQRTRVLRLLGILSEDSSRHKKILDELIVRLEESGNEK